MTVSAYDRRTGNSELLLTTGSYYCQAFLNWQLATGNWELKNVA